MRPRSITPNKSIDIYFRAVNLFEEDIIHAVVPNLLFAFHKADIPSRDKWLLRLFTLAQPCTFSFHTPLSTATMLGRSRISAVSLVARSITRTDSTVWTPAASAMNFKSAV